MAHVKGAPPAGVLLRLAKVQQARKAAAVTLLQVAANQASNQLVEAQRLCIPHLHVAALADIPAHRENHVRSFQLIFDLGALATG